MQDWSWAEGGSCQVSLQIVRSGKSQGFLEVLEGGKATGEIPAISGKIKYFGIFIVVQSLSQAPGVKCQVIKTLSVEQRHTQDKEVV